MMLDKELAATLVDLGVGLAHETAPQKFSKLFAGSTEARGLLKPERRPTRARVLDVPPEWIEGVIAASDARPTLVVTPALDEAPRHELGRRSDPESS